METSKYHALFDITYYKTRINKATILQMGYPKRVRFLVNQERKELIVQPCNQHEPLAFKVPKDIGPRTHGLDVNSLPLLNVIYKTFGWDRNSRYLAFGRYIEKDNIIVFDLSNCQILTDNHD